MKIWGISANSHDASITVVENNNILFAAHSERYSEKKNDAHLHPLLIQDAEQYGKPDVVVVWQHWCLAQLACNGLCGAVKVFCTCQKILHLPTWLIKQI